MTMANQASRIGPGAEMAHVGVQRLAASHDQEDRAKYDESRDSGCAAKKSTACAGLMACSTCGAVIIDCQPRKPMVTNQTTITGPNIAPTEAVPRCCTTKSPARMSTDSGTMYGVRAGVTRFSPSTGAEHGDSGRDDAVAVEQRGAEQPEGQQHAAALRAADRCSGSAPSARGMPPSPWLSARIT